MGVMDLCTLSIAIDTLLSERRDFRCTAGCTMKRAAWPSTFVLLAISSAASAATGKLAIPAKGVYLGLWGNTAPASSPAKTSKPTETFISDFDVFYIDFTEP
jgi:hypothetical protein